MKKFGMTLAEIMITLTIIGIISAILLPMANKAKPNETKAMLLKNYDELTLAIKEMANNSKVFPNCQDIGSATRCFEAYPFLNDKEVKDTNGITNLFNSGRQKFCEVLAFQYDVDANCSDTALPDKAIVARNNNFSFTTKTGAAYRVLTNRKLENAGDATFISEILIDVNGNGNGTDCMYADTCQDPDTFRFWVTADGEITAGDRAAEYYIRTRQNLKSKHIDVRNNTAIVAPNSIIDASNIN